MKRSFFVFFLFFAITLSSGCTSSRGLIDLNTMPSGAIVYLDGVKQGVTPVQFEYDFEIPARLELLKDGYHNEYELLNQAWVIREIRKGNYTEGNYMINGVNTKSWVIGTSRKLQRIRE